MRYIINSQFALSRSPEGPLADHIVSFAQFLSEQGYGLCSMRHQVLLAACFSRWLGQNEVGVHSICAEQSARYLRYRARYQRPKKGGTVPRSDTFWISCAARVLYHLSWHGSAD
jgi:integrase/recombinase XerD